MKEITLGQGSGPPSNGHAPSLPLGGGGPGPPGSVPHSGLGPREMQARMGVGSSGPCQLRLAPQAGRLASGAPRPPGRRGRQSRAAAAHVTVAFTRTQCVALMVSSTPTPAACRRPPAAGARGWSPRPLATATSVRTHAPDLGGAPSPWNALPHLLHHTPSSITSSTLSGITLSCSLPSPPLFLPSLPLLSLFPFGHRLAEQPLLPFLVTRASLPPLCVLHPYNFPPT